MAKPMPLLRCSTSFSIRMPAAPAYLAGGRADEAALALAVDGNGSLIVGRRTSSTNFPAIYFDTHSGPAEGNTDTFVGQVRVQPDFNLQAATYLGGNNIDYINAVAVDNHNNYVAGHTASTANSH